MNDGPAAWSLLQLAELLRTSDELLRGGLTILDEVALALRSEDAVTVGERDLVRLRELGETLGELAARVHALSDQVPREAIDVTGEELADAVLDDLEAGIIDPMRVRLAARTAPAGPGWRALAVALRTTDAHAAWEGLTAEELLAGFRDAPRPLVEHVLAVAGLPADARVAHCDAAAIERLASALEAQPPDAG